MPRVVVVGSINVDVVACADSIPRPGETIVGSSLTLLPGGKGANQAVAAHRLGAPVLLAGAIGTDAFSQVPRDFFAAEGIDDAHIVQESGPTGTALIVVDGVGENSIVIIPGANERVWISNEADLNLEQSDVVLLQNEVPEGTNLKALMQARRVGARCILNLAPYRDTSVGLLSTVDYLVVNETEFASLLSIDNTEMGEDRIAGLLAEHAGPAGNVVVTIGEAGMVVRIDDVVSHIQGHHVPVIDTTGAGDCFCGAFGAALMQGLEPVEALRYANAAAALSVQRSGAGPSMPVAAEVKALLGV